MATPVNVTYSVASGLPIYGGRSASAPTWLTNLALSVNQWGEIPNSNVSAAQQASWTQAGLGGSVTGILAAWNGMSVNTLNNTAYMLANGGHNDYWGNQAISCDFTANAPAWIEAAPPSAGSDVVLGLSTRTYLDGRPPTSHTYYTQQFDEINTLAIRIGTPAIGSNGGGWGPSMTLSFDPSTGLYAADHTHPDSPFSSIPDNCVFKNPANGRIYLYNNLDLAYWDPLTNTWTQVTSPTPRQIIGGAMAVDTVNNRAFYPSPVSGTATGPCTIDMTSHAFTSRTLSGAAAASVDGHGRGMIFQSGSYGNRFLLAAGGSGNPIITIDADTFVATDLTTTGGGSIPAQQSSPNGIYTRFQYLPLLGGCVYVPLYAGNCWFLRTE